MVAVPLWLSVKVTPAGSGPFLVRAGAGNPLVVMVNGAMAVPAVTVVPAELVMDGTPSGATVRVNAWVASGLTPFTACRVKA
jgi:hypothetical protein